MTALVLLRFIVHDHDNLFVAAEAVHSIGISVLIYKLMKEKTCAEIIRTKNPFLVRFFRGVRVSLCGVIGLCPILYLLPGKRERVSILQSVRKLPSLGLQLMVGVSSLSTTIKSIAKLSYLQVLTL
ncbi:hypothetical protein G4B88_019725 [Cannabis sativa]|uniref:Uncharacterized protein n=1 Tax=Cannabis sativa TaxID=3483 RepID=A0A7J6HRV3_CANSA|nr:hypothetical protein G4B88_019725 [Cannabis sativa]